MHLEPYVQAIRQQLEVVAEGSGSEARALAERLAAQLEASIRLAILDVLSAAAQELTVEMAPGCVELRLRGREPDFVVTLPPSEQGEPFGQPVGDDGAARVSDRTEGADGNLARINLRIPDQLKSRVEKAAAREGLSVNAWLVRAASAAVGRTDPARRHERRSPYGTQRYTGWAR